MTTLRPAPVSSLPAQGGFTGERRYAIGPHRHGGEWTMRDRDVRAALLQRLAITYAGDDDTRIVQEMGIWSGSVRIDIAVINCELVGYELKSDRDTLERLPLQADLYSRVFDRLLLVVGERHFQKAVSHVPEWWGVLVATKEREGITLLPFRKEGWNPSPEPYLIAQLLWKDEAIAVLESYNLARGWRGKRVKDIHQRLASEVSFDKLRAEVRTRLKERRDWLWQPISGYFNMSVDPNPDPMLKPLGASRLCSD